MNWPFCKNILNESTFLFSSVSLGQLEMNEFILKMILTSKFDLQINKHIFEYIKSTSKLNNIF